MREEQGQDKGRVLDMGASWKPVEDLGGMCGLTHRGGFFGEQCGGSSVKMEGERGEERVAVSTGEDQYAKNRDFTKRTPFLPNCFQGGSEGGEEMKSFWIWWAFS